MSTMKHTPGPWLRDRSSGYECDVRAANGRKIAAVAGLRHAASSKQGRAAQQAEDEANAVLIAASPDLLAVAHDFKEALQELGLFCECGEPDCRTTRLRAAIVKATGSAP